MPPCRNDKTADFGNHWAGTARDPINTSQAEQSARIVAKLQRQI